MSAVDENIAKSRRPICEMSREERVPTVVRVQILGFLSLFEACSIARVSKAWQTGVTQRQRQVKELAVDLNSHTGLLMPSKWQRMLEQLGIVVRLTTQLKTLMVDGAECGESWACVRPLLSSPHLTSLDLLNSHWAAAPIDLIVLSMAPLRSLHLPPFQGVPRSFHTLLTNSAGIQDSLQYLTCSNSMMGRCTLNSVRCCKSLVRLTIKWNERSLPLQPWLVFLRDDAPPTLECFTINGFPPGDIDNDLLQSIPSHIRVDIPRSRR
jgi:hypothetical protein